MEFVDPSKAILAVQQTSTTAGGPTSRATLDIIKFVNCQPGAEAAGSKQVQQAAHILGDSSTRPSAGCGNSFSKKSQITPLSTTHSPLARSCGSRAGRRLTSVRHEAACTNPAVCACPATGGAGHVPFACLHHGHAARGVNLQQPLGLGVKVDQRGAAAAGAGARCGSLLGGGGKVAVMAAGAAGAILQHLWVQSMSRRLSHNKPPAARSAPEPHLYGTFFSSSVSSARWQKGCKAEAGRRSSTRGGVPQLCLGSMVYKHNERSKWPPCHWLAPLPAAAAAAAAACCRPVHSHNRPVCHPVPASQRFHTARQPSHAQPSWQPEAAGARWPCLPQPRAASMLTCRRDRPSQVALQGASEAPRPAWGATCAAVWQTGALGGATGCLLSAQLAAQASRTDRRDKSRRRRSPARLRPFRGADRLGVARACTTPRGPAPEAAQAAGGPSKLAAGRRSGSRAPHQPR